MSSSSPNDDDQQGPKRSVRKRVSTIVHIDGHAVLAKNNYVLKGGNYEMGAFTADPTKAKKKTATTRTVVQQPRKPRKQSESEVKRLAHNERIKERIRQKEPVRHAFLSQHRSTLAPFLDTATVKMLDQWQEPGKKPIGDKNANNNNDVMVQPDLIVGVMRDYQLDGLNFMVGMHKRNVGMILGDEMGLGKTLQTISLFCHLKENNAAGGPSLVVCPLSVLYSWCAELARWAPSLKVLRLHSANQEEQESQRKQLSEHGTDYDVIVTTYEMVKVPSLMGAWGRQYFQYLVLDEGHKIKSKNTHIAQAVRKIHCENRLILTGTPLQNNLSELFSLLNFLCPDVFKTVEPFEDAFQITINKIDKEKMFQAHQVLDLFMLRRLKGQVEKLIPPKLETKVYCPLSKMQKFWYKALLMKDLRILERATSSESESTAKQLSNLIMQLRKCCLHPFLFDGAEPDIGKTSMRDLIGVSGKLAVLDALLRSLYIKGHRVVLFSQFTSVLDILQDFCNMRGWKSCAFDGRSPRARRNYLVQRFNAPESPYFIFLMSTRSGGMGINLQSADTCILFDSDWNPQQDLQAMARVHRIGQSKTVHVYRLVSAGTIEERMIERAEKKLLLDQMVNRERASGKAVAAAEEVTLSASQMLDDIKFGCQAVFGGASSQDDLPSESDIEAITDRSRTESDSIGKLKGGTAHGLESYDANKELSATQTYQGINFAELRREKEQQAKSSVPVSVKNIADLWLQLPDADTKRERKSRIQLVDGMGSGYGSRAVPVLASNNYELEHGESSVFARELATSRTTKQACAVQHKKRKTSFENQSHCQLCGDGGMLMLCSRCPVSVHPECAGIRVPERGQWSCSHHSCALCNKTVYHSGGLLFPCQTCPVSFCEDCLPAKPDVRILGACPRFEELGYDSEKQHAYINCSAVCENYAKKEGLWTPPPPPKSRSETCPKRLEMSEFFGKLPEEERVAGSVRAQVRASPSKDDIVDLTESLTESTSDETSSFDEQ